VFYRLRKLKPGAILRIWRAGEPIVRYKVMSITEVLENDFPSKRVFGDLSYPGCGRSRAEARSTPPSATTWTTSSCSAAS
jgi:hypothetical protein